VGASIIVLGAQGEPGFPKFSCTDPDGWASPLRIPPAIKQTAAKAINFLFLMCYKSPAWLNVRSVLANGQCKLTPIPEIVPALVVQSILCEALKRVGL
jgi:hypothetical protein